ncbi:hypothetical protein L5515_010237 [Caenorhabditis briggsae]|uniref:Uncharacterized protein n=1 Tax=Caenorhabditis briggsae TaxID=6238 RepID=A0AAE9ELL8_CAEBR|nr:hypothetical protein L5515_010237 [Caenorhabditis briggsae]
MTDTDTHEDSESCEEYQSQSTGIHKLIPPFVRDMCSNPMSVALRVAYDAPTQQSTYTYSITWEDELDPEEKYMEMMEKLEKVGSATKGVKADLLPTPSDDIASHHGLTPVSATCDGPCKKSFPSNLLLTLGRCGHYLCAACYGIVKNSDGTSGCSAAHCNWKGETRKESKKNFEKEICQKQRIRAREMKSLGIDVKSASAASSKSNSKNSSPAISTISNVSKIPILSETDCSILLSSPISSSSSKKSRFHLIYPSEQEIIGVKLFILDQMPINGRPHTVAELEFLSHRSVKHVVTSLIIQKLKSLPAAHDGVLYHVELQADMKRRLRRVRTKEYHSRVLCEFSQIAEHIIFVLDFGRFVKDGQEVNIG